MSSDTTLLHLPLHGWHEARGACFADVSGAELPLHYGDPDGEYEALRKGCGVVDDGMAGRLELRGEDRLRFLSGLVTCEVTALRPGDGAFGFFTDVKGRILADVVVLVLEDRLWLRLPPATGDAIEAHLSRYRVADRVEIGPLERTPLLLVGPGSGASLAEECPPWRHGSERRFGTEVRWSLEGLRGEPASTLWVAPSLARELLDEVVDSGSAVPVGQQALETVRVEAGVPRFGVDFGAENLPQETGLDEAVSYDKGCYLGQEVVARLHYRGQAARWMRQIQFRGDELVPTGTPLLCEGRPAGTLTSCVHSPRAGSPLGLSMLQRRAAEPGTVVFAAEVEGVVRAPAAETSVPRET